MNLPKSLVRESTVEHASASSFALVRFACLNGTALDEAGERSGADSGILAQRLAGAVQRFSPALPPDTVAQIVRTVQRPAHPTLIENNRWLHGLLTDGVEIEYRDAATGENRGGRAHLVDFDNPTDNDFLVVRQLSVATANGKLIRPDLIVYLNGLPLAVIELKDPTDESADLGTAIEQLARYMRGAPERIERAAAFIAEHWEKRREAMEGKAMVVTMSRDIAARLYEAIRRLKPAWHDADDDKGVMKVVMTGGPNDEQPLLQHARSKAARKALAARYKDPASDFRLVIVCDMWLTGFDCPPMHTMYLDTALAGHNLMQAIARVNRVYGEKPGGLVVDLLGLADQLADALATYTQAGGRGDAVKKVQDEALPTMKGAFEKLQAFFHDFDYGQALEQKNLALETLRKLLTDQIRSTERTNLVQSKKFREALEDAMLRYTNKAITTAEMIARLLDLAKWVREVQSRGQELGLSTEETAFYDAIAENESARKAMANDTLRLMARELAEMVKRLPKLDWTQRESVRADLRRQVRRLLARYGYPPDLSEDATQLVLKQAELSTANGE